MAKRFFSTKIWDEDWFLDMPIEYRLFWFYILSSCDHAGVFKVNLGSFCRLNGVKIEPTDALVLLNTGKQRIREINNSTWLIEDFFCYQYGGTFNPNNRVHESIERVYKSHGINMTSIRGLKDLKEGVKDKDKDKDKEIQGYSMKGGVGGKQKIRGVKFSEDGKEVVFPDGSSQELGGGQILEANRGNLSPNGLLKGFAAY